MGKKVEKLKKLYVQNGGSLDDVANIKRTGDMIDALADLELGGGNDFIVTYTEGENDTYTADKTFAEIQAAIEAGKNVFAKSTGSKDETVVLPLGRFDDSMAEFSYCFAQSSTNGVVATINHDNNEDILVTYLLITVE